MQEKQAPSSDKNVVDRTRKKSAAGRLVRDLRQRTGQGAAAPIEFELELMTGFAQNHRNAFVAMPVFIAFVAAVSGYYAGLFPAIHWFLLTTFCYGLMAAFSTRFIAEAGDENVVAKWRRVHFLALMLIAMCWSIYALYGCPSCTDNTYSIVKFSTILVVQAITMILSYGFGASMLLTSAPPTILLSTGFILTYEPGIMLMGGILVGAQAFFYFVANRFKLSVLSLLRHKAEKDGLIAELETARAISDEARRRAEEANLAKSRFLATMSHELRTPLNAILGFSEVMQGEALGPVGNVSYRGYIDDIHASGQHLLNVINEILDLSRIEAGKHELSEEAISLGLVIDDACHMVQLKAKAKNIGLTVAIEENLPQIWADERAVRQVGLNLLSNALKFTPPGGAITVKVGWTSTGGQYLSIRDNGPGIPEDEIPVVLSTFGQGSIAIKSAEQGTGLGLPIVQALISMHDGKFELKSKLREGTEAIATFPRSRVLEILARIETPGAARPQPKSILAMRDAG